MSPPQIKWLRDVIPPGQIGEFAFLREIRVARAPSGSVCLLCKGGRMLCGKSRCPLIARAQSLARSSLRITSPKISGSTPPGIFVGRIGYPKVYIGPMVPPFRGDTAVLDTPEMWLGKEIQEIIDYRFALVRGKTRADVHDAPSGGRLLESLQELAMGEAPVDAEVLLERLPTRSLTLGSEIQPFGPSAPMKSFQSAHVSVDRGIERAFYDRDLKAADAVLELYGRGVLVSRIQRAFSLGMFGIEEKRRLVPTRWSITAVDSIISQELIGRIKEHDPIDEYRVYRFKHLDNRFVAILMPEKWSYEWIEAWFPGTTWNPDRWARKPAMMGDFEPYRGRTTYPDVGGCYYACRLAVAERLSGERRQASVLVLREIHPGYILPVGVWNVRESVRKMMEGEPRKFDTLRAALDFAMSELTLPLQSWIEKSELLKRAFFQRKITEFG
jgi:hypothetical protein